MAIIIDTNCLSRVFNRKNKEFPEFEPVFNWIIDGNGFIVYGGSKYMDELKKSNKYLSLFANLNTLKKTFMCKETESIDRLTEYYKEKFGDEDFDDPHLPAIVLVTKCHLICSKDIRSFKYIKCSKMYSKRFKIPQIYYCKNNANLLNDSNIDNRLKCFKVKLNKKDKDRINDLLSSF